MRPHTPEDALLYPTSWIRDLGLSLDIRCPCSHSRQLPLRALLRDHPHLAMEPLGRIVLRLTCQATCRQHPTRVVLLDVVEHASHAGNARSSPLPWHLVLVGDP